MLPICGLLPSTVLVFIFLPGRFLCFVDSSLRKIAVSREKSPRDTTMGHYSKDNEKSYGFVLEKNAEKLDKWQERAVFMVNFFGFFQRPLGNRRTPGDLIKRRQ